MLSTVSALADGSSEVLVNADIDLVGKIVQFGRGMIEEVSKQMFRQFSNCVKQQLEAAAEAEANNNPKPGETVGPTNSPGETKAVNAAALGFSALWAIVVRFFKRLFGKQDAA
jgi:hypothetical protein